MADLDLHPIYERAVAALERCPECGGKLEHDEIDNGVGMQQVGPDHCGRCDWFDSRATMFDETDPEDEELPHRRLARDAWALVDEVRRLRGLLRDLGDAARTSYREAIDAVDRELGGSTEMDRKDEVDRLRAALTAIVAMPIENSHAIAAAALKEQP